MAVRVAQAVLTALWEKPTASPTAPAAGNVAVTHAVLEALMTPSGTVRVAHSALEALMAPGDTADTPGGGGGTPTPVTRAYGYAV